MAEVASAFVSLLPSAKGFGSKLDSQIGGEVQASGKKAGRGFGLALKGGLLLAGGAAAGAGLFLKSAIDDSSDLSESASKVGVVFGKQAGQIMKASKTSATAMGLTKSAYLDATGTLGNLLVSLDIAPKKSAAMSQQMVKLAGDLASFNNTSPEEALDALKSGLTGETEPLKRFGVNMNDATLKAQALKLGLIKSTKEALTPQNKALAAQALIMAQTKTAQGDFARTSGGLANQQRILAAQFGNLKTSIGSAFLPVATKAITFLNGAFTKVGPVVASVKAAFSSFGGGGGLGATLASVGTTVKANFLPVLQTMATTFQTVVLPAMLRLGGYLQANLMPIFRQVGSIIATQVVPIVASLARFFYGTLYPAIFRIATVIGTKLKPVFDQLFATLQGTILPVVQRLLAKLREWGPTMGKVASVVLKVVGVILIFAATIIGKVLPVVIRLAGFLIKNLVGAAIKVVGAVAKVIGILIRVGAAFVGAVKFAMKFGEGINTAVRKAIGYVKEIPGKIKAVFSGAGTMLLSIGGNIVQGLVNGIQNAAGRVLAAAKSLIAKIPGPIRKIMGIASPSKVMHKIGEHIGQGLINGLKARESALKAQVAKIAGRISDLKQSAAELTNTIASKFQTDLFGGNLEALKIGLALDTSKVKDFQAALATSVKKGLSGGLYRQLAESGNVALAQQFASASKGDIAKYEDMFNARNKAATAVGSGVASSIYGAAINAQTHELQGIRADLKRVLARERVIHVHEAHSAKKTAREVARREAHAGAH